VAGKDVDDEGTLHYIASHQADRAFDVCMLSIIDQRDHSLEDPFPWRQFSSTANLMAQAKESMYLVTWLSNLSLSSVTDSHGDVFRETLPKTKHSHPLFSEAPAGMRGILSLMSETLVLLDQAHIPSLMSSCTELH
jgi:hypothetical protein